MGLIQHEYLRRDSVIGMITVNDIQMRIKRKKRYIMDAGQQLYEEPDVSFCVFHKSISLDLNQKVLEQLCVLL